MPSTTTASCSAYHLAFEKFKSYAFSKNPTSTTLYANAQGVEKNLSCKLNVASEFKLKHPAFDEAVLPANCGLAALNVDSTYYSTYSVPESVNELNYNFLTRFSLNDDGSIVAEVF